MAHFTQLNLQGGTQNKSTGAVSGTNQHRHFTGRQKTAAFVGSLVASSLLVVFLLETSGCSKGNDKAARAAIASPAPSSQPPSMPTMPAAAAAITSQLTAKNTMPGKSRQRKLSASTYANQEYGISLRYPKSYTLMEADDAGIDWAGVAPVEMNFVQPGGTTLTAVELPQGSYPGTDFSSAFFNISVNTKLAASECAQFALPQADPANRGAAKLDPSGAKLGAAEFTEVEDSDGESPKKSDVKYYHLFQNGTCYEFALGLETTASKVTDTPVNRNEVFRKLNWILSTVKIEPAHVPAKAVPEVAAGSATNPAGAESKN